MAKAKGLSTKSDLSPKSALGARVSAMSPLPTRSFCLSLRSPGDRYLVVVVVM